MALMMKFDNHPALLLYRRIARFEPSNWTAHLLVNMCKEQGLEPGDAEFRLAVMIAVLIEYTTKELREKAQLQHEINLRADEQMKRHAKDYLTREIEISRILNDRVEKGNLALKIMATENTRLRSDFYEINRKFKILFRIMVISAIPFFILILLAIIRWLSH